MSSKVAPLAAVDAAASEVPDSSAPEACGTNKPEISEKGPASKALDSDDADSRPVASAAGAGLESTVAAEAASSSRDMSPRPVPQSDSEPLDSELPASVHARQSAVHGIASGAGQAADQQATDEVTADSGSGSDSDAVGEGGSEDESSSDEDDSGSEYEVPVRTHGDWDAFVDEDTGIEYYYNRQTGETTWDVPDPALMPPHLAALEFLNKLMTNPYDLEQPHPLSSHGEWSLYVDADSMAMYYCNDESGDTSWDPPPEWNDKLASIPPLAVLTGEDGSDEGGLAALVAAKAGDKPSKPSDATASTAREPRGPDSERTDVGSSDETAAAQTTTTGAQAAAKSEKQTVDLEKGLESIDQEKVWFVYRDIENLMQYFVNAKTGQSLWEPPLDIASQVIEHEAASIQPGEWQLYTNKEEDDEEPDDCVAIVKGWEVYQDRSSGRWYYYNPETGDTQWDAPDAVLQAAPEDWEAGGASTDADGNVVNHGEDEEPFAADSSGEADDADVDDGDDEEDEQSADEHEPAHDNDAADGADGVQLEEGGDARVQHSDAAAAAEGDAGEEAGSFEEQAASADATAADQEAQTPTAIDTAAAQAADDSGVAPDAVAHALVQHQESLKDEEQDGQAEEEQAQPAMQTPERPSGPVHLRSRCASRPQSKPPTRPPTAGRKKSKYVVPLDTSVAHCSISFCRKDKSDKKKKDKSKKKKDKSKKKKGKSKKKKKSKDAEAESDSDSDLGDLLGANAAFQHERPLAAGAAVQQTIDMSQRHRAASNAGGASSVMDAIAMIQRAYGNQPDSDEENGDEEEGEQAEEGTPAPPKEPVQKADENATYKIFMPPPPKPSGNTGLGFGLAMGVKSRFGKKPLAPGMDVEDPEEEERKRRQAEQEAIRARILAAQEAKRKQEEEDAKLAELEGNDAASANALNLLASAAGLSATELAKMLERRKVDDPNNKGLLAWAKAFLQKTQKKAKTLESRLRLDTKIDGETKAKLKEEIHRLKLLCDKLREWEEEERKRRREMDEEMKAQLKAQAEAEKARLADKRAKIRADREAAKQRAADERKRKAEEARQAMQQRKARDAELKAQREAAAAAELERKRALAASVKS